MIFVLIAGTYTPICLLALPPAWGVPLLVVVWAVAIAGIALKMAKLGNGPGSNGSWLYIVMGWAAIVAVPALVTSLTGVQLALMAVGGVLYTGGAIVLARRWPDPLPRTFGYHEIWHTITVAAGGCHFALVALLVH
jgi:hemolysin III